MTIEEKAKSYDEALERAKECYIDGLSLHQPVKDVIEHIFPELKESEDERIRNQIINFIEEYGNPIHCEWQKDWIVWLEKQREKKLIDKVKPKFKVGDWVTIKK